MTDNFRDKITKLLNMTVENGCSEDEQESAMRIAASLAAKAGIDLDSCRAVDAPRPKAKSKNVGRDFKPHQALSAEAAAILYGCEANSYNLGADGIVFVGRDENIELAEQTWFWLMRQVELLYKQALPKGLSQTARGEFRKTFKAACAARVRDRAWSLMQDLKKNDSAAQAATGHNALVVLGHFEQLQKEISEYWDERVQSWKKQREDWEQKNPEAAKELAKKEAKRKGYRRGRSIPTGSGTNAGFAAGDRVKLREEVQ
jgi:hypothetical protein